MVIGDYRFIASAGLVFVMTATAAAQDAGSIRGIIYDADFEAPLGFAQVVIVETGDRVTATEQGNFSFGQLPPGRYTLVFSKEGYVRQVKPDVQVSAGQLTDVDASLTNEFTELEETVVQDILITGSDAAQLQLQLKSPSFMNILSSEMMSRAVVSDAAAAIRLVSGATVQDGKYAVIRGLPDRYVVSLMNGVRLPSADEDKRAVQLDQFPTAIIDSIQVSKTFTPDMQGDSSGGAVNVLLKGIPNENIFQIRAQKGWNSQVGSKSNFLTYTGGGVNTWGMDNDSREQQLGNLGLPWEGAAGVSRGAAPEDYKRSLSAGGKHEFDTGVKIGGFFNFFYERDSEFFDNGIDDSYWVTEPGEGLVPETNQGLPDPSGVGGDFKTALFNVTQGTQSVQWGGLGAFGIETENHSLNFTYLQTRIAEDTATLAEDTRGKAYFFPDYDVSDPQAVGNEGSNQPAAPYLRTETLEYTERTTSTFQVSGKHRFETEDGTGFDGVATLLAPEIDWVASRNSATMYQPDKRQFGSLWYAPSFVPGVPFLGIPDSTSEPTFYPYKPAANFTLGNVQRIWKEIDEESTQYSINLKLPFEQWTGDEGYFKTGLFYDRVTRDFNQDTFSNFSPPEDPGINFVGDFSEFWSAAFPDEMHPITAGPPFVDVGYEGEQRIAAQYLMMDLPLNSWLNVIGGARFEGTDIGIRNFPEADAVYFPPGTLSPVTITPGSTDVDYVQDDILPSIGLQLKPFEKLTFRASYSETVARQTFKELTPIQQQEFLGGDVFIGNPELRMSALQNFDLRLDYNPYEGGLISLSWFHKKVELPIEYVQEVVGFAFTTPVNYPEGELSGWEFEVRQSLGEIYEPLAGFSVGGNVTFIDSEVTLPPDEVAIFASPSILAPRTSRDMTNAPEHLYNLYASYDFDLTGTQLAMFYTVQGDTLVAGAGESDGNFVPDVYALEYGTLNASITQRIGKHFKLQFQAKNITNPEIDEVYRSEYIGADVLKTRYTKGIDFAVGLSAEFLF